VSCSPSEDSINTAIAQTQAANPTETPAPTDTLDPTQTYTSTSLPTDTPTPSDTPSPTLTPTPTPDLRIIAESSDKLLLQANDLSQDAKYYYLARIIQAHAITQRLFRDGGATRD